MNEVEACLAEMGLVDLSVKEGCVAFSLQCLGGRESRAVLPGREYVGVG